MLWLFVLGWMSRRARSTAQRRATIAAVLVLVPTFFGADLMRTAIVVAGLLMLQFFPTVRLPRVAASAATTLASASLAIYLTHFGVLPLSDLGVPSALVFTTGIPVGIASWWVFTAIARQVTVLRTGNRSAPVPPVDQHQVPAAAHPGGAG